MFRRILRWIGVGAVALLSLALLVLAGGFLLAEREFARRFEVPAETLAIPADAASVAEGARLARLRGCNGGCHGKAAEGRVFFELFDSSRLVAPDLGRLAQRYSVAELEQAIRHGVRPDGSSTLRVMPAEMFAPLSDRDLAAIIAWMRSLPAGEPLPPSRFGPLGRLMLLEFKRRFGSILAAEVATAPHAAPRDAPAAAQGRYLATTVCTECHGQDLRGFPEEGTPGLAVVAAYPLEAFSRLMRSGQPIGDRELGLMAGVARSRFAHFTDEEIAALHAYLHTPAKD